MKIHPVLDVTGVYISYEVVIVTGLDGDMDLDEELQLHTPHERQEVVQVVF